MKRRGDPCSCSSGALAAPLMSWPPCGWPGWCRRILACTLLECLEEVRSIVESCQSAAQRSTLRSTASGLKGLRRRCHDQATAGLAANPPTEGDSLEAAPERSHSLNTHPSIHNSSQPSPNTRQKRPRAKTRHPSKPPPRSNWPAPASPRTPRPPTIGSPAPEMDETGNGGVLKQDPFRETGKPGALFAGLGVDGLGCDGGGSLPYTNTVGTWCQVHVHGGP